MHGAVDQTGVMCCAALLGGKNVWFQGWSSAYSVESVILQIAATLVKGKARVQFDVKVRIGNIDSARGKSVGGSFFFLCRLFFSPPRRAPPPPTVRRFLNPFNIVSIEH
jgi:hypothetical protein